MAATYFSDPANLLSAADTGNELLEALEYIYLDELQAWDELNSTND